MQRKLLFFVNPRAGHSEIRGSLMQAIQIFTAGGYEVTVHPTSAPRDLTRQIAERAAGYDLVVCTGGDGTLNEAVSGLMQLPPADRPPLGYIPGGTVNDVAKTLGLSLDPILAAQDIVTGREFPIDIGAFGKDRWFVYVAAFGLFTGVSYQTPQEDKQVLGRLAYFLHGVKALGEVKPIHARVEFEDQVLELDVLDGLVCSTTSVGGVLALVSGLAFGFASGAATGDAAAIFWVALVCGGLAPLVCGWLARSKPASAVTMATVAFAGGIIGSIAFRAVMWMVGTAVANYFGIVL